MKQEIANEILDAIKSSPQGLSCTAIKKQIKRSWQTVATALDALEFSNRVKRGQLNSATVYLLDFPKAKARTITTASRNDDSYLGIELQRNPGIPESRFAAFELPRREGYRLYWPDGKVTKLDGITPC